MNRSGHQGRRDANHQEIVKALRQAGCSVLDLGAVGGGCPDLLVGRLWRNYLLEVKTAKGKLTAPEIRFMQTWCGSAFIVRTVEEALRACNA